jgi:DNA-binding CsgD family transcriptional regulator
MDADVERRIAVVMSQNRNNATVLAEAILSALDLLTAGVVMLNSTSQVLFMNRAAEDILRECDGLQVVNGILQVLIEESSLPIQALLKTNATFSTSGSPQVVSGRIQRISGTPLTVVLRAATSFMGNGNFANPTTLLFILDPDRPVGISRADLHQLYGLTYTESNLVNWLMDGKTLEECRELLGVRPSTVRMHLRNVLGKTGTASQGELVWLLFKNLGLVGSGPVVSEVSANATISADNKMVC